MNSQISADDDCDPTTLFLKPPMEYTTDATTAIILTDCDADGYVDLFTVESGGDAVRVFAGTGTDQFSHVTNFYQFDSPQCADVVQLRASAESRCDVIAANADDDDVTVYRRHFDFNFYYPTRHDVGSRPLCVVALNMDENEVKDLVTANFDSDDLSILMSNGDLEYLPEQRVAVGDRPTKLATLNLGPDQHEDIAVLHSSDDQIWLMENTGTESFEFTSKLSTVDSARTMVAIDINLDGLTDLAVLTAQELGTVEVFQNMGKGSFRPSGQWQVGLNPASLNAADLNDDGYQDLFIANRDSHDVSVLYADGNGAFLPEIRFGASEEPADVEAGDINADGLMDLLVLNQEAENMVCLLGTDDGQLQGAISIATGSIVPDVLPIDMNGDGNQDLISSAPAEDALNIFLGDGNGHFTRGGAIKAGQAPSQLQYLDVNDDDIRDIIVLDNTGLDDSPEGSIDIMLGRPDGTFEPFRRFGVGRRPCVAAAGDFDGDSICDLVVCNFASDTVSFLRGLGGGEFATDIPYDAGQDPRGVQAADFDMNGTLDLVIASYSEGLGTFLYGNGDGTFALNPPGFHGVSCRAVIADDLDEDGIADLVVTCQDVNVCFGNGDGTFNITTYEVENNPDHILYEDLDGDGIRDLLSTNIGTHDLSYLRGLGNGLFEQQVRYFAGISISKTAAADFDNNGRADIVMAIEALDVIVVMKNQCDGVVCAADIEGDDLTVDVHDLLTLLINFGSDGPGADLAPPVDIVGIDDLEVLLAAWGDCK